ncbi:hypothetical protein CNF02085 [Cryptococcus deneoformans JEC21]|uniref:Uncharacterized protein n=1 Tax=Cryptococcus deneoformans (strain JEC21 / ATCC MYA-565) TaxID=214684 RepID=A0A0S2M5B0_CRYD1|nr:hypothetical protein CNF02085 [Cryptococcus neoformans var. neoformans JEC21]ALO68983.1 hypothetical protein CNF02085 [Cryptococcus neoformans var. neoformans JEC21]
MVRSGLQQDVINLYRQGMRIALSKPAQVRPAFLLHLRYNFRNPPLRQRDYVAIEHQLRKMSKTLEMLSDASVQRISVSNEMEAWWAEEVSRARGRDVDKKKEKDQVKKTNTQGRDRDQFGGRLPGHGGT